MSDTSAQTIFLYTDGSCKDNPGAGGCACVIYNPIEKQYAARTLRESHTTNNRMELSGMLLGLEYIEKKIASNIQNDDIRHEINTITHPTNENIHSDDMIHDIKLRDTSNTSDNTHSSYESTHENNPHTSTPTRFMIFSDSQYVVKGINEWMHGWIQRNWKNAAKEDVKNPDLWQKIYKIHQNLKKQKCQLDIKWIKAHTITKLPEKSVISAYQQTGSTYGSINAHHIVGNHLVDMLASCESTSHEMCMCREYVQRIMQYENDLADYKASAMRMT